MYKLYKIDGITYWREGGNENENGCSSGFTGWQTGIYSLHPIYSLVQARRFVQIGYLVGHFDDYLSRYFRFYVILV